MSRLKEIFNKYDSKKNIYIYENLLNILDKIENKKILEIGLDSNLNCLKLWNEYYNQNVQLFGFDFNQINSIDNIKIFKGDQGNIDDLIQLSKYKYNLIIEDGSHYTIDQQVSLKTLFPYLEEDGIYIIENINNNPLYDNGDIKTIDLLKKWSQNIWITSNIIKYDDIFEFNSNIYKIIINDNNVIIKKKGIINNIEINYQQFLLPEPNFDQTQDFTRIEHLYQCNNEVNKDITFKSQIILNEIEKSEYLKYETILKENKNEDIAYICRYIRLNNPYNLEDEKNIFELSIKINIPIFLLISKYLHDLNKKIFFTYNSYSIKIIYDKLYNCNSLFYRDKYKNEENYLIFDINNISHHINNFNTDLYSSYKCSSYNNDYYIINIINKSVKLLCNYLISNNIQIYYNYELLNKIISNYD